MKAEAPGPGGRRIEIDDARLAPYRAALAAMAEAPPVRLAFAAAHVVVRDGYRDATHRPDRPAAPDEVAAAIDWEATLGLRRRLDRLGFGIAEAMDTAQRSALGAGNALRLVRATGRLGLSRPFLAGAGADGAAGIAAGTDATDLARAVAAQGQAIQEAGGMPLLLPLPALARHRAGEDDYVEVYRAILDRLDGPVFVHWLGPMFRADLAGYFPGRSFERVMGLAPDKVRGAKLSLLDPGLERRLRRDLATRGQVVLTGDDLHFASLILGDDPRDAGQIGRAADHEVPCGAFSHALLGILDAVAVPASLALRFLARGEVDRYLDLMLPCEALGRWVFQEPVSAYKAGLAFLAWIDGLQDNPMLLNHEEGRRDRDYYLGAAELAAACGALTDADLAADRLRSFAGQKP